MQTTTKNQRKSIASIIATTLVVFAAASSALAAQPADRLTKRVTYGDLNLESPEGAKALYSRLRSAAQEVCSPFDSKELSHRGAWRACVDGALEAAVAKIDKPLVSALHNQSAGRSSNGKS
jgi:UrcA family protein